MGMFDQVTCQYPLPDGYEAGDTVFQTKELDNALEHYTITPDGRLVAHRVRYESVPEEERPYWGTSEWDRLGCGSLRPVPVGDEEVLFHGDLRLYRSNICMAGPEGIATTEYIVRFTNGRVEWIRSGLLQEDRPHLTCAEMQRLWDARWAEP